MLERMPGAVLRKRIGKRCGRLCHVGIPVAGEGLSGTETSRREVDNWQKFQLELAELNSFANFSIRDTSCRKATRDAGNPADLPSLGDLARVSQVSRPKFGLQINGRRNERDAGCGQPWIKALEEDLGRALFHRHYRGVPN
ncbi:MAG: LysR family transcriptional regulator [Paracoccaceae bacterium]